MVGVMFGLYISIQLLVIVSILVDTVSDSVWNVWNVSVAHSIVLKFTVTIIVVVVY